MRVERGIRRVVQAIVVIALCAMGLTASVKTEPLHAEAVLQAWSGDEACTVDCYESYCDNFFHKAYLGGNRNRYGGGSHASTCWEGTCDEKHRQCAETLAIGPIRDAVLAADSDAIRSALDKFVGTAYFAAERQAIQVVGCDKESVVANIPLPSSLAEALVRSSAQQGN